MRTPLLLATSNPGKLAELRLLLGPDIDVVSLADVEVDMPEETGDTFADNAILKAVAAARQTGMRTLADDSGLVVDGLGGRPGVRSARFAGEDASEADNRSLLRQALEERPGSDRGAHFVCVVAMADSDGRVWTETGTLHGAIIAGERGAFGFGYDSMFELPDGRTLAELTPEEKGAISHRGKALRAALPRIRATLDARATPSGSAPDPPGQPGQP